MEIVFEGENKDNRVLTYAKDIFCGAAICPLMELNICRIREKKKN